jgi:hypothetical protein
MYTTPLSTYFSKSSANHHLYVDDTQLYLSFSAAGFSRLNALAISNVSNCMSANFLTLDPSKTEFLVIGLSQQLSMFKSPTIHLPNNVTLTPVDSARNLGVILDKNLSFFSTQFIYFQIVLSQYS